MEKYSNSISLAKSFVVANCNMNRERHLCGVNSYEKDLKWDIVGYLQSKKKGKEPIVWMDLCCGKGKALVESLQYLDYENYKRIGVDLVGDFYHSKWIEWHTGMLPDELPEIKCDLITCVHGIHYLGDKLCLLSKVGKILKEDGLFIANIDHRNIKSPNGKTLRGILKILQNKPFHYTTSSHILFLQGYQTISFPYIFIESRTPGKSYTFQDVVDSYYIASDSL